MENKHGNSVHHHAFSLHLLSFVSLLLLLVLHSQSQTAGAQNPNTSTTIVPAVNRVGVVSDIDNYWVEQQAGFCPISMAAVLSHELSICASHDFNSYYRNDYDDTAVGIVANRSQSVGFFRLPFTESMVVPIKALRWDLWLTIFILFVNIGVLIWILEHRRINEEFRGPTHQIGTLYWFAFSNIVFAQKEKIVSNSAKLVLIIWFLVVLILRQAYTSALITTSNSLGMKSFWGFLLVMGLIVAWAFILYLVLFISYFVLFLHDHQNIVTSSQLSFKEKLLQLSNRFNAKDLKCHTFRDNDINVDKLVLFSETTIKEDCVIISDQPAAETISFSSRPNPSIQIA